MVPRHMARCHPVPSGAELTHPSTLATPQVRHGHTAVQQQGNSLTALERGVTERSISGLLIYRLTVLPSYRHPRSRSPTLMSERHVPAPWSEKVVHNMDNTVHPDAQRWSGMTVMCTSSVRPWNPCWCTFSHLGGYTLVF